MLTLSAADAAHVRHKNQQTKKNCASWPGYGRQAAASSGEATDRGPVRLALLGQGQPVDGKDRHPAGGGRRPVLGAHRGASKPRAMRRAVATTAATHPRVPSVGDDRRVPDVRDAAQRAFTSVGVTTVPSLPRRRSRLRSFSSLVRSPSRPAGRLQCHFNAGGTGIGRSAPAPGRNRVHRSVDMQVSPFIHGSTDGAQIRGPSILESSGRQARKNEIRREESNEHHRPPPTRPPSTSRRPASRSSRPAAPP